jgi:hypothetical protein
MSAPGEAYALLNRTDVSTQGAEAGYSDTFEARTFNHGIRKIMQIDICRDQISMRDMGLQPTDY